MKLHFGLHGYPAEDWQKRFVIFDQSGSTCRVVSHPIMPSDAMSHRHEITVLASHSCDMEENPAIMSQAFASASFPKLLDVNSNGKEVNLHNFNSRESAPSRSFEKCNWKLLEDEPEDESGSQLSCASHPWRERSEDIDVLLSSDEELSTGRSPNMDEKMNITRTSGLATGKLINKLDISGDEDQEVNSAPSTCNPHNQHFGKSIKSSKAQRKRKIIGLYHKKQKSSQGRTSSFKSRLTREDIRRNLDLLKEGQGLNTQLVLEQAINTAK
ncbi:uncharacterized protein LOC116248182 [Nymphaea colorata]|uniref:uncharacterized protein LOC116248182 n=1 Tax=Nymphaea colorata TaxID=210225 RepID=UPI00129E164A|nr:uncharacterized protein LOC116248182 [Nymphaea colorata]XP_031476690.1 uncharacterized protein LOC116248182 [Nymphaea colorata]